MMLDRMSCEEELSEETWNLYFFGICVYSSQGKAKEIEV